MYCRKAFVLALVVGVLVLGLAGCNKVTKANYDKIEVGMAEDEVIDILGKPDETTSAGGSIGPLKASGATHKWVSGDKTITVVIANGKVVSVSQTNLQ